MAIKPIDQLTIKRLSSDDAYSMMQEILHSEGRRIREEAVRFAAKKNLETGLKEGEIKGELEMAKASLFKGVDIAIIVEALGLTKEEIEKLK